MDFFMRYRHQIIKKDRMIKSGLGDYNSFFNGDINQLTIQASSLPCIRV